MAIKVILSLEIILQNCIESSQYVKIIGWGLLRLRVKWLVCLLLNLLLYPVHIMFEFEITISFSLFTSKDAIKKDTLYWCLYYFLYISWFMVSNSCFKQSLLDQICKKFNDPSQ